MESIMGLTTIGTPWHPNIINIMFDALKQALMAHESTPSTSSFVATTTQNH